MVQRVTGVFGVVPGSGAEGVNNRGCRWMSIKKSIFNIHSIVNNKIKNTESLLPSVGQVEHIKYVRREAVKVSRAIRQGFEVEIVRVLGAKVEMLHHRVTLIRFSDGYRHDLYYLWHETIIVLERGSFGLAAAAGSCIKYTSIGPLLLLK